MAFVTFAPSVAPSPSKSFKPEVKVLSADFGDGYTQDAPHGLNNVREVVSLNWAVITEAQMQELDTFFTTLKGATPFYFTPRGMTGTLKWTCKAWQADEKEGYWSFSATIRQAFTAAT